MIPPLWKPTSKKGLLVDVSEPAIAQLVTEASHLTSRYVGLLGVAQRAIEGDEYALRALCAQSPADARAELDVLGARLAAAARFLKGQSTDFSESSTDDVDPTLPAILQGA